MSMITLDNDAFDPFTCVLNICSPPGESIQTSQTKIYFQTARMQLPFDNKVRDPIL